MFLERWTQLMDNCFEVPYVVSSVALTIWTPTLNWCFFLSCCIRLEVVSPLYERSYGSRITDTVYCIGCIKNISTLLIAFKAKQKHLNMSVVETVAVGEVDSDSITKLEVKTTVV